MKTIKSSLLLGSCFFMAALLMSCDLTQPGFVMTWTRVGTAGGPAFQSGWDNTFAATQLLSFGIDSQGFLHVNGAITDASPVSATQVLFTLPVGFRPATMQYLGAIGISGGAYVPILITIATNGTLFVGGLTATIDSALIGDLTVRLE